MNWDYIVIGAGSAGCAVAHELAKCSSKRILVLEAGGSDRSATIKIPALVLRAIAKYDWGYKCLPDPSRGGASENWPRGRVLGGSSSINGMLYVRGAAEDYDRWDRICGSRGGWSAAEVTPIFRYMEHSDQDGDLRGHEGPLYIKTTRHPHPVTERFVKSVCSAGYPFNVDYNGRSQEGVSYMQRTQRGGLRWSAADAFLRPALGQSNLQLLLDATVERIQVSNGRAVAVSFVHQGKRRREIAGDIVLCAGAINSPKLLMLSGIGDPEELRKHSIGVVVDSPGVGRNLQEQPIVRVLHRSRVSTYNLTEGPLQKLSIAAKFARYREGPIAGSYESAVFLRTQATEPYPDVMMYFAPIGYLGKLGEGRLAQVPAFMTCVAKMRPASSGRVRLGNGDPTEPPLIQCNMLSERADVDTLVRGIEVTRRIMSREPIASVIEEEIAPGASNDTASTLQSFVRRNTEVSAHPIGTCRMGLGSEAVVDPTLLVRGLENLWIADASIMPDHPNANLNAVCIMIGIKLGRQLIARG